MGVYYPHTNLIVKLAEHNEFSEVSGEMHVGSKTLNIPHNKF